MLFLNCKENTELLSQAQDRPATAREKWAMRLHLLVCGGCRNFDKLRIPRKLDSQSTAKWTVGA